MKNSQKDLCAAVAAGFATGEVLADSTSLRASTVAECPVFNGAELAALMLNGESHKPSLASPPPHMCMPHALLGDTEWHTTQVPNTPPAGWE